MFQSKEQCYPPQKSKNLLFVFSINQTKTCQAKAFLLICENLRQGDILQRNLVFTRPVQEQSGLGEVVKPVVMHALQGLGCIHSSLKRKNELCYSAKKWRFGPYNSDTITFLE